MIFNDCLKLSSLFLYIFLATNCKEALKNTEKQVSLDTSNVTRRLLEEDNLKKLDTTKLIYELGDTREYIQGQIISRVLEKGLFHPDTIKLKGNDSNHYSLFVPNGYLIHLIFPDRKRIWLNSGTILIFAGMIEKSRRLKLNGEACFDVKENKDPLIVETKGHKIFLNKGNLNLNTFNTLTNDATLMGGVAMLYGPDGQKIFELRGRKTITFGNKIFVERHADLSVASSWTKGFLEHDQTLDVKTFYDALGRWYDVTVKMPNRRDLTFGWNGRFRLESSLKNILDVFKFNGVKLEMKLDDQGKMQLVIL